MNTILFYLRKRKNLRWICTQTEELGLSREKASELLEIIMPERIEKIESEKSMPHPDEVLTMRKSTSVPLSATTTVPPSVPSASST